jgi:phosphoribosylglycinamide formyltransferase 1
MLRLKRQRVVSFLVSGNGFLFSTVAKNILKGKINATIGCIVTDNNNAKVIERAAALNVRCYIVDPEKYLSREQYDEQIIRHVKSCKTDVIVTAGYLRLLTPLFVNTYRNRIINIHPSLLPAFPGLKSQKQAYEYGVQVTGCTTHFIDEGVDTGPVIMQATESILDLDTVESLSARILKKEVDILTESVKLYCDGKIQVQGLRVTIKR